MSADSHSSFRYLYRNIRYFEVKSWIQGRCRIKYHNHSCMQMIENYIRLSDLKEFWVVDIKQTTRSIVFSLDCNNVSVSESNIVLLRFFDYFASRTDSLSTINQENLTTSPNVFSTITGVGHQLIGSSVGTILVTKPILGISHFVFGARIARTSLFPAQIVGIAAGETIVDIINKNYDAKDNNLVFNLFAAKIKDESFTFLGSLVGGYIAGPFGIAAGGCLGSWLYHSSIESKNNHTSVSIDNSSTNRFTINGLSRSTYLAINYLLRKPSHRLVNKPL